MSDDALFDDIVERDLFLELVADGVSPVNAGWEVGWTPIQTRRNLADPEFGELVRAASERANGVLEHAMFQLGKKGNMSAIQMWLYNRDPERWKDVRRIEVKSEVNVNVGAIQTAKAAVLQLIREQGAGVLQPQPAIEAGQDSDIVDAEVVDEDG